MNIISDNLFLQTRLVLILLLSFFLFGCQTESNDWNSAQSASSSDMQVQSSNIVPSPEPLTHADIAPEPEQWNKKAELQTEKYKTENAKLQQCQSQLDVLEVVTPAQYARIRASFDSLMKGAAQYAGVRQKINSDTQDTVDALYRYRANLLCAQIAQKLLEGLTHRDEVRP